jgi:glycosyltransferase involved in cell wall biosynthesis
MPFVSVIIPTYNRVELLRETLLSVLSQTFQDYEILVIDDGSTDNTHVMVQNLNSAIRYFYQENQGTAPARNTGIGYATGDWLAFLDSDDLWKPQKLARQVAELKRSQNQWIYCDVDLFDQKTRTVQGTYHQRILKPYQGWVAKELLLGDFIPALSTLVHRDVFKEVGLFNSSEWFHEDWEMWLKIASKFPISYVPETLGVYRQHQNKSQSQPLAQLVNNHEGIIDRAVQFAPAVYSRYQKKAKSVNYQRIARMMLVNNEFSEARKLLLKSIHLSPFQINAYTDLCFSSIGSSSSKILALRRSLKK